MNFRLAEKTDDAQLRALCREAVMPGHIQMQYRREPNFFLPYADSDVQTQVMVAESDQTIVGVGCRSVRRLWVDGQQRTFGYLSGLRLKPEFRNAMALARGYKLLKTLDQDRRVPAYLTTIIAGNQNAERVLTHGRANLPVYHSLGCYQVHAIPVKCRARRPKHEAGLAIARAADIPDDAWRVFLMKAGAKRQFFPVYDGGSTAAKTLASIGLENILVAKRNQTIVGVLAVWDQSHYKQHLVAGYSRGFRVICPFVNGWLRTRGVHPLPRPGKPLRCASAGLICIRDHEPAVFASLLNHALALAANRKLHQLAVGLHEADPLTAVMKDHLNVVYRSHLYLVAWDQQSLIPYATNTRSPYLELGTL